MAAVAGTLGGLAAGGALGAWSPTVAGMPDAAGPAVARGEGLTRRQDGQPLAPASSSLDAGGPSVASMLAPADDALVAPGRLAP